MNCPNLCWSQCGWKGFNLKHHLTMFSRDAAWFAVAPVLFLFFCKSAFAVPCFSRCILIAVIVSSSVVSIASTGTSSDTDHLQSEKVAPEVLFKSVSSHIKPISASFRILNSEENCYRSLYLSTSLMILSTSIRSLLSLLHSKENTPSLSSLSGMDNIKAMPEILTRGCSMCEERTDTKTVRKFYANSFFQIQVKSVQCSSSLRSTV